MIRWSAVLMLSMAGIFLVWAAPAATAGPYNWTGFYAGLNAGAGFGGSNATRLSPAGGSATDQSNDGTVAQPGSLSPSGFTAGGQIGYNRQFTSLWVGGLETDLQYANLRDSNTRGTINSELEQGQTRVGQQLQWFGTLRGRFGVLPIDRLLLYGTGGLAYGRVSSSTTLSAEDSILSGSSNVTRAGWTAGGGAEWAFMQNWSVKVEYLYYDLGSANYNATTIAGDPATISINTQAKGHIVRAGLNYKF